MGSDPAVERVWAQTYTVPTDSPEADATASWTSTTIDDLRQAGATCRGGVTGFLRAATLREAYRTDLSAHCAPAPHFHPGCAAPRFRHLEWFHDHVRIEHLRFDGAPVPHAGIIAPDLSRPGLGLTLKREDASRFAAGSGDRG
jgi:hypothetical protein